MRLLLIAYHYPPVNNGGVERPAKFVRYLPDHGVEVTVLTHTSGPSDLTSEAGVLRVHDHCREGSARVRWAIGRGVERIVKVAAGHHLDPYRAWRRACVAMADAIRDRARPDAILRSYPPIEALEVGLALATRNPCP